MRSPDSSEHSPEKLLRRPHIDQATLLGSVVFIIVLLALVSGGTFLLADVIAPTNTDQFARMSDMVKFAFAVPVAIGAAAGLVVTYRRQQVLELGHTLDKDRAFTARFESASNQLGSDKAAVRLAGSYALARLADDWVVQRQVCIDVLCAYLRMPYDPANAQLGEKEVRLAIIKLIRDHLQENGGWIGSDLNLQGATFDECDFSGAEFSGGSVEFFGANFSGTHVYFRGAKFSGSFVRFMGAKFLGAHVSFSNAEFSGGSVVITGDFHDGSLDFEQAEFSGGSMYISSHFSDGYLDFIGAKFSGSVVKVHPTTPSGSSVDFYGAEFSGGSVDFYGAEFSGGSVSFGGAKFLGGSVSFGGAKFLGGSVDFSEVTLARGTVDLREAKFDSGELVVASIDCVSGQPVMFLPSPIPKMVTVPEPLPLCISSGDTATA